MSQLLKPTGLPIKNETKKTTKQSLNFTIWMLDLLLCLQSGADQTNISGGGLMNVRKMDSMNYVQSSLKFHPLSYKNIVC